MLAKIGLYITSLLGKVEKERKKRRWPVSEAFLRLDSKLLLGPVGHRLSPLPHPTPHVRQGFSV